jgi:hypothetical protein
MENLAELKFFENEHNNKFLNDSMENIKEPSRGPKPLGRREEQKGPVLSIVMY